MVPTPYCLTATGHGSGGHGHESGVSQSARVPGGLALGSRPHAQAVGGAACPIQSVAKEEHDLEPAARDDGYISPRIYMCEEPCATTPHHICDMEDHNITLIAPLLWTKAAGRDGS